MGDCYDYLKKKSRKNENPKSDQPSGEELNVYSQVVRGLEKTDVNADVCCQTSEAFKIQNVAACCQTSQGVCIMDFKAASSQTSEASVRKRPPCKCKSSSTASSDRGVADLSYTKEACCVQTSPFDLRQTIEVHERLACKKCHTCAVESAGVQTVCSDMCQKEEVLEKQGASCEDCKALQIAASSIQTALLILSQKKDLNETDVCEDNVPCEACEALETAFAETATQCEECRTDDSSPLVTPDKCEECARRATCTCQLDTFSQTSPGTWQLETFSQTSPGTCQLETFSQTSSAPITPEKCEECAKRAQCTCQLETFSQTSPALVEPGTCKECARRSLCTCHLETFSQTSPAPVTPEKCEECAKRGKCTCQLENFSQTSPALATPEKCKECAKRAECTCQLETFSQTSPALVTPEKCEECAKRAKCTCQLETFSQTSPALATPEKCEECAKLAKCTCQLETFSQTSPALVTPEKCEECAKRAKCTCHLETFSQTSPALVTPEKCEECAKRAKCTCQLETFSQTSPALVTPEKCEECARRLTSTYQLETFSQTLPALVTPDKCEECARRSTCTCQHETFSQTSPDIMQQAQSVPSSPFDREQAVLSVVTQAPSEEPAAAINVHVNVQVRSSFDSAGFLEEVKRQITTAMEQAGWSNNLALEAPPAGQSSDQIRRTPSPNVDTQTDGWVEENDLLLHAAEDELPLEEFKRQIHHQWKSSACFKIAESVTEEFQLDIPLHVSRKLFEKNSYIQSYFDQAIENKQVTYMSRRDLKHGRHFAKSKSMKLFEVLSELQCNRSYPGPERENPSERSGNSFSFHHDRICLKGNLSSKKSSKERTLMFDSQTVRHSFPIMRPRRIINKENAFKETSATWEASHKGSPVSIFLPSRASDFITELLHYTIAGQVWVDAHREGAQRDSVQIKSVDRPEVHLNPSNQGSDNHITPALTTSACVLRDGYHKKEKCYTKQDAASSLPMQKSRERTTEQLDLSIKTSRIPCQQWKNILELDTGTKSSSLQLLHSIEDKLSCIYFSRDKALLDFGKEYASSQEKKQKACRNVTKITKTKSMLNNTDCRSLPKRLKVFGVSSLKMMMGGDFMECNNQKNIVDDMGENEEEESTHGTVVTRRRPRKRLICLVHTAASYSKNEHSRISEDLENNRELSEDQSDNSSHHLITMKLVSSDYGRALHKVHEKYAGKKQNWARHDEMGKSNKDDGNMKENLVCMNDPINIDDNACKHLTSLGGQFVDGLEPCSTRGNTQNKPEDTCTVASLERTSTAQVAVSSLAPGTENETSKQEKTETLSETVCRIHLQKYVKSIVERACQRIRKHNDTHLLPDNDFQNTFNVRCALCKSYSQSLDRRTHKFDEERSHGVVHQSTINKRSQDGLDISIAGESVKMIAKDCGLRNGRTEQALTAFVDQPVYVQAEHRGPPNSGKQSDHQVKHTTLQDCTSIGPYISMVLNIARTKVKLLEESAAHQIDSKNEIKSIRALQSDKTKARLKMQSIFSNDSWLDFLLKDDSEILLQEEESTIAKTWLLSDKYDSEKEFRKYEKACQIEQETSLTNSKVGPLSTSLEAGMRWYTSSVVNGCHQESSDDSDLSDVILSIENVDSSASTEHLPSANAFFQQRQENTRSPSPQNSSLNHAHATESVSPAGFSDTGDTKALHDFSIERQTHRKTETIALSPPKESNFSLNRFENKESSTCESIIFVIKTVNGIDAPRDFSSGFVPNKSERECSSCTRGSTLLQETYEARVNRETVGNADINVAGEPRQAFCAAEKQPQAKYPSIHSSNGVEMTAQSNGQTFSEPDGKIYTNSNMTAAINTHPVELVLNDLFAGDVGSDAKGPSCIHNDSVVSPDYWSLPVTEPVYDPNLTVSIKPRDNDSILQEAFTKLLETIVTIATCKVLPQLWALDISGPDQLYCAETVKSSEDAYGTSKMWMFRKSVHQSDLQFITVVSPEREHNLTDDPYGGSLLLIDSELDRSSRSSLLGTSSMCENTASSEEADCFYSGLSEETASFHLGNVKKVQDNFKKIFSQQEEQQYKLNFLLSENMSAGESLESLSATVVEISLPMQTYFRDIGITSEQRNEIKEEVLEYTIEFNEESKDDEDRNVQIHSNYHQNAKKNDERALEINTLHTGLLFPCSSTAVKDDSEGEFNSSTSEVALYNECRGLRAVSDSSMLVFCAHQGGFLSAYSSQSVTSQCCVDTMSDGQTSATACDQRVHTAREVEYRQEGWRETSMLSACRSCSCSSPTVRDCSKCSVSDTWIGFARRSGLLTELIENQLKEWPVSDTEIDYDSYVYTYRPRLSNSDYSLKVSNKPEMTHDSPVFVPANSRGEDLDTVGASSTSFTDTNINTTGYEFSNYVVKVFRKSMIKSAESTCDNLSSYTEWSFTNSRTLIDTAFRSRNTYDGLYLEKENSHIENNPIGGSVKAFEEDDKRTTCKISNIECSTEKDLQSASLSDNGVKALRPLCCVSNGSSNILYSCKGCSKAGSCCMSVNSQTVSVNSRLGFQGELPLHNGITSSMCGLKRVSSAILGEEDSCFIRENKELLDLSVSENSGLIEGSDYSYAERKEGSFQNGDSRKKEITQNDQNNRDKISTNHVFEESCLNTLCNDMNSLTTSETMQYDLFPEVPSRENLLVPSLEVTFHESGFVSREECLALKEIGLQHVLSQSDQTVSNTVKVTNNSDVSVMLISKINTNAAP